MITPKNESWWQLKKVLNWILVLIGAFLLLLRELFCYVYNFLSLQIYYFSVEYIYSIEQIV